MAKRNQTPAQEPHVEADPVVEVETARVYPHEVYLADIAAWADGEAELVEAHVNPTNVFALRYRKFAEDARSLIALIEERGHTGVPKDV